MGIASWYAPRLTGHLMANSHFYDPKRFTCASYHFALGTRLRVSLHSNRRHSLVVLVSDRGPARRLHRDLDLSSSAFAQLAPLARGLIRVDITKL